MMHILAKVFLGIICFDIIWVWRRYIIGTQEEKEYLEALERARKWRDNK